MAKGIFWLLFIGLSWLLLAGSFWWVFAWVTEKLDRVFRWHQQPPAVGVAMLAGLRMRLREQNLHDSNAPRRQTPAGNMKARYLTTRTADGTFNDLEVPEMGAAGTRFGRNVALKHAHPENDWEVLHPNPRTVSRELLTRHEFQPVEGLNLLAASWLQFMVRGWLSHGEGVKGESWKLPVEEGDDWPRDNVEVLRTPRESNGSPPEMTPTYTNTESHWWDASQIYGSSEEQQARVRSGKDGKLEVEPNGLLPTGPLPQSPMGSKHPVDKPGFWLGFAMIHVLFALEHNAICDRLKAEYPSWSDDDIFERARLINAALLAKIHTVEWTTAILNHPTMKIAMNANWWGLAGEKAGKLLRRVSKSDALSGIPGSTTNHFGVPYSITEEFVAVYRMHPLIPDDFDLRSASNDESFRTHPYSFRDIMNREALTVMNDVHMRDLFYSFGTLHPGKVVLHNFPKSLQMFKRPNDGEPMDLAATDILRSRELGVPRYNEFRKLLRLPPARTFEELTDNPDWAEELRRVYDGDVDRVDLTIGMYAETFPEGFGFSETAIRIFILMASRRLNSDRFFTTDYTPRVYTQTGMDWIEANDMSTVLLRHFPALRPALRGVRNAFSPWTKPRTPK